MRYSYATVSLPDLTPEQAVDELSRAGFRGVEWKVGEAPNAATSSAARFLTDNRCTIAESVDAARRAGELTRNAGLAVVGLGPYVRIGDTAALAHVIEMAQAAGAPQIRLQAPRFTQSRQDYQLLHRELMTFLSEAERRAAEGGVRVVLEIHQNTIVPSASLAHAVVSHFDAAAIGVIYDVGNMVIEGYEDHRIGLSLLGPYVHHVHLKNVSAAPQPALEGAPRTWEYQWSALDDGFVDVAAVLSRLDDVGYAGWVSMEDLSLARSPRETLWHNAKVLAGIEAPGWK